MEQVKESERGGGGGGEWEGKEGRKKTLADNFLDFENLPHTNWDFMLS